MANTYRQSQEYSDVPGQSSNSRSLCGGSCAGSRSLFRRLRHLGPQFGGGRRVHLQVVGDRHQVDVAGAFAADPFLPHVVQHLFRRALVRRAVAAAAGD